MLPNDNVSSSCKQSTRRDQDVQRTTLSFGIRMQLQYLLVVVVVSDFLLYTTEYVTEWQRFNVRRTSWSRLVDCLQLDETL